MATKDIVVVLEFDDKGSYKIKKVVGEVSKVLGQAGTEANRSAGGFTKLRTEAQKTEAGFGKLKGSFKSTALAMAAGMGVMMGMTGAISMLRRGIQAVMQTGEKFSKTFAETSTMIQGTAEEIEGLRMAVIRMSPHLGSTTDLAHGLYQVLSASVPKENAISFLAASAKAAKAGATDTFTAVDALTTVINAYGKKASEVTQVSDVMFKTVLSGKTTYAELASSIGNVVTLASQVGVSFEEVSAAIATLTRVGIDATKSTTSLRMVFSTLLGPQKAALVLAEKLGINFSMAGVRAKGFAGWLKDVIDKTGGSTEKLDVLFGNIRALTGILALAGPEYKNFVKDIERMVGAAGATDEAFRKIMKSTAFWMDSLRNIREKFQIGLFEGLTEGFFKGLKTQEEFQKKFEEFGQSVFGKGKSIGEGINKIVTAIVKLKDEIILLVKVWGAFFVASKAITFGKLLIGGIEKGLTTFPKLATAAGGLTAALGTAVAALAAFAAGWKIGEWLSDVTGLKKKILEIGDWGIGEEDIKQLKAMTDLKAMLSDTGESAIKLKIKYGSYSDALKAVTDGTEKLITAKIKERTVTEDATRAEEAAKTALELLREKLKTFGYNLKEDLEDRYNTLTEAVRNLKGEITTMEFEKLKKDQKELGALLGKTSAALLTFGILTKTEVAAEVIKITKYFWDLKTEMTLGNITWEQYKGGIDQVNEALKNLDPTLNATVKGMTKLVNTPLPSPRQLPPEFQAPAITPGLETSDLMMTKEEIQKILTSLGPSFALLKQYETELGVPLKALALSTLPAVQAAFKYAMDNNLIATANLGQAADNLIAHFKNAGEEIPKWLQDIADKAEKVSKGMGNDMIKGFSTLGTALQVLGDTVGEKLKGLVSAGASVAGQLASSLTRQFNEMGGKGKLDFKNLKKAFKELSGELAGSFGAALGGIIGGGGANTYGGIGSALGGALGSILPGVGNVIGSLVGGLFGGLFKKKKTAEQKAAEELKRQVDAVTKSYKSLGDITEGTAKKIIDLTKQYNKQTATIMTLTDVMADAGISMKNLGGYITKMKQALKDISTGAVDAVKGLDAIASAFNSLITWAQKFGTEGSKALISFMQYLRQIGVSIAEVDAYVFGALEAGAGGLKKIVDSVGGSSYKQLIEYRDELKTLGEEVSNLSMSKIEDRQGQYEYLQKKSQLEDLRKKYDDLKFTLAEGLSPELERVGRLTVATFNAFMAQGKSMSETFALMGDGLVALRDKYTELGLTGGAAIEDLFKLVDIQKANEGLFAGLEGTRELLEALGNTGFLTAESMADLATQAAGYYDQLIAAGMDPKQALAMIAPTLQDLVYYAEQYGLKLDAGTELLVAQAKAAGTWKERGRDINEILESGFADLINRADRLITLGEEGRGARYNEPAGEGASEDRRDGAGRRGGSRYGFDGTVTGPRNFYIEPGVTEAVKIGRPEVSKVTEGSQQVTVIEKNVTFEPVVIPMKFLQSIVIEWVQKAGADERILFRPRAVRGRG